ncbi:uncharacterized protein EV420DRAFT_1503373 [Desarmillaria tabescens]|uniref:CID domain-containing protein n=1 Tax=Armillaria tabescens TaxID=1929756 RepID=A0AA39U0L3_ARMTA|nr:uncharacterized protein EV420DRAFT_1503373 [Desarmillaria tabescens]KAK0468209.1 hypothetical protein EV420DRAFT_1503373 [Desarmillaria tabescens]
MSLYQQSYYSQPAYPTTAFSPPILGYGGPAYPYPSPFPPAPVHHADPVSFRKEFTSRLAELSVNSRPIIQGLSILAHEYTRFADIVAQCLENHIRRVPPWMKLPAFYLLDMISKNIYDPYARHFASFVVPLFLETYAEVDPPTRSKMEELVLTWRTGSPSGKELFGVSSQVSIERGIWGDGATSSSSTSFRSPTQITKSQVLSELEFILGQKERARQANPYDGINQQHIAVLQQLRKLVETGVSQQELQQILGQLRVLSQNTSPPPPPPVAQWPVQTGFSGPSQPYPQSTAPQAPAFPPLDAVAESKPPVLSVPSISTPVANTNVAPANYADLLSSLLKAGVVSNAGTPVGAGATTKEDKGEPDNVQRQTERLYRESVLAYDVQLTTNGITKMHSPIRDLLYSKLSSQCKQCGIRFSDTPAGKESMQEHLDMHFRQNRKANQNLGRGHSRSWFVAVEDWIHDTTDIKGKGRDATRRLNPTAAAAAEKIQREAELRQQFVVVPPGDEAKVISCPICKETLKSEFLEDDEEWVWKNAMMKDGRVYHATCRAETLSSNSLAARLRTELAVQLRSRSGTPEAQARAPTPPSAVKLSPSSTPESKLAGSKRKVDETLSTAGNNEAEGSPPAKKPALTVPTAA